MSSTQGLLWPEADSPKSSPRQTVSHPEARELGFSSFLFWELFKKYQQKEERTVERNGIKMKRELAVVPLEWLQRARQTTSHGPLVAVSEASRLTQGAFSPARMEYWEEVGCPFLNGKKLTVAYKDAIVPRKWAAHGKSGETTHFVKNAKHYVRSEIIRAWRNFKRMAERKGTHIDRHGDTWITAGPAWQKYRVREQALRHWHIKGWLARKRLKRKGPGRYKKVRYYRELGSRGIAGLIALQRPGDRHIVMLEALPVPEVESRSKPNAPPTEPLEKLPRVYDVNLRIHNLRELVSDIVQEMAPQLADELVRIIDEKRPTTAHAPRPSLDLTTDTERNIVEALAAQTLKGEDIAKKAGYPYDSHFRTVIANLKKRGILCNEGEGYFAPIR
jgi:hypothetical protein